MSEQLKRRQKRERARRQSFIENLEDRLVFAGPELFAIRPDELALLGEGDVLNVAPREFNLLFKGGADIKESTIRNDAADLTDDSIKLVRSGHDGIFGNGNDVVVDLGYVGLNEPGATDPANLQQVVMRVGSSAAQNDFRQESAFPDDTYQIQIFGASAKPLTNRAGEAFLTNGLQNFTRTFRLDRGAQVISAVPQPVARNVFRIALTGGASSGNFTLTFRGATTTPISATATAATIQTALQSLPGNVIRPNDILVTGTGPWDVTFQGQYAAEQSPALTANNVSLNVGNVTSTRLLSLAQARNQIVVYFDDQDLNPTDAIDPKFYRLFNTQASVAAGDDSILLPQSVTYDSAANRAALTFASPIPDGTYRLEIGSTDEPNGLPADALAVGTLFSRTGDEFTYVSYLGDDNGTSTNTADQDYYRVNLATAGNVTITLTPGQRMDGIISVFQADGVTPIGTPKDDNGTGGTETLIIALPAGDLYIRVTSDTANATNFADSYRLTLDVAPALTITDANSSFSTATDLGALGAAGQVLNSQIETQSLSLPEFPGSRDEPGHRDIQGEKHSSGTDIFDETVTPNGISTVNYFFGTIYGQDSFGNNLTNQITEGQKQLIRQILDLYSSQLGVQFLEVTNGNTNDVQIVTGSVPAVTNALVDGTFGRTKTRNQLVALMDASKFGGDDKYGGPWFLEAVRQVGKVIGGDDTPWLLHSFDLLSMQGPGVSVATGSARFPGDPAYTGPIGEPVFPGDHDLIHHKREARPDSTDIDMYRFRVDKRGTVAAEITSQRNNSLLDSVLTLFDAEGKVVAQNDNYFSKDSYVSLELEPGTYFLGVTSTGNANYNPNISNTGFGGETEGQYQLNLTFQSSAVNHLRDASGVLFDGDADGDPQGTFQFWFQSSEDTIFVDKANDLRANQVDGDGNLTGPAGDFRFGPYDTLDFALQKAGSRIVAPPPTAIADGEKFDVRAGNTLITFEFNKSGPLPANGVDISTATTADQVATAVETAITNARTVTPSWSGVTMNRSGNVIALDGIQALDVKQSHGLLTWPNLVRIVGNGGLDRDLATQGDNVPYLLGRDNANNPTADGAEFLVPQGATVMVDAGALFKMRRANLVAGTSSTGVDRSAGAIQILGVPGRSVYFRSLRDDTVGGDSDGVGPAPAGGDYGGIVFRADSDLENDGVFLNWVNHADIDRGAARFRSSPVRKFSRRYTWLWPGPR